MHHDIRPIRTPDPHPRSVRDVQPAGSVAPVPPASRATTTGELAG